MKVIGITGGVGAGKSSVLALLKEMCSCDIIQADLVARNIYHSGNIGFKKVVDIFGEQIVGEDGEINRPLLADIIFKNPNKRIVLNSIIHPLVKQEIINQINNHKIADDVDYCFVEAALLIEDPISKWFGMSESANERYTFMIRSTSPLPSAFCST